jgi:hypothetical protein
LHWIAGHAYIYPLQKISNKMIYNVWPLQRHWNIDIHTCLLDSTFLCPSLPSGNSCYVAKKNRKIFKHKSGGIVVVYRNNLKNHIKCLYSNSDYVSWLKISQMFKDWSQFVFGSWRNNLNQVVHNGLRKGMYNLIEFISNEPNK